MKVRVINFHSVAHWRWNLNQNIKSNANAVNGNAASNSNRYASATPGIVPTPLGGGNIHGSRQSEIVTATGAVTVDNDVDENEKEEADEEEDDCCPICRRYYDLSCPDCKHPGEDCPIMSGPNCRHSFHLHCIYKWITQQGPGKQHCPMCREPWEFDQ